MPHRRCNATRRAAAAVAQQRGRRLLFPGGRGEAEVKATGVRRRRTGPGRHRTDRDRCPGDQDRDERPQPMPWPCTGNWAVRTRRRAPSPRRSGKAWTFLSLARPMTVASSCVRPAVRASAKAASTVPENIAGVSRIHAPRAIAGAATPAATISSRRSAVNAAAGSHRPQTRRRRVRSHRSGGGKASIQPSLGRPRKL
jgi:hypothetical protein